MILLGGGGHTEILGILSMIKLGSLVAGSDVQNALNLHDLRQILINDAKGGKNLKFSIFEGAWSHLATP